MLAAVGVAVEVGVNICVGVGVGVLVETWFGVGVFVGTGVGAIVGEGRSVGGTGVSVGIAVDLATKTLVGSMDGGVGSALGVHPARAMTASIIAVAAKTRVNIELPAVKGGETSKPPEMELIG